MSDAIGMRHLTVPNERSRVSSLLSKPWIVTLLYCVAVIAMLLIFNHGATDYVGVDNDDAMRLVEVRDLLGGQGWFDMMQYRMGLDGGTLMHWSRFIDLPIACLIAFFRLFAAPERAEALALAVWPVSLVFPIMFAMALLGRRIGGLPGLHVALGQTALLVVASSRFVPGSIDHDNVQLCLVALLAAMLADEKFRSLSYVVAGVAAAVAIGIGVETTPFIAVVCVVVAILWAWEGAAFAAAARAFALTLTVAISIAFFSTVPPHLYSTVTCDNLSLGFYGITSVGGAALLVSAIFASRLSRPWRFVVLAANGAVVFATTLILAPNCLHNPLADLDPMLIKFWLNAVTETQSILSIAKATPQDLGAFYAVGFLGLVVCLFRIMRGDRVQLHAIFLAFLLVNWAITVFQVRGALFADLLAIPPLTLFILDLRRASNADTDNVAAAFFYVVGVLISFPVVWAFGGGLATSNLAHIFTKTSTVAAIEDDESECISKEGLAPITGLDPGVVVAPSNLGASILRFTNHRVLSAPYHRNAGGMLTELHIGLAIPSEAEAFMRGAHATILIYCPNDPQTQSVSKAKPDGLYAQLGLGKVPPYLERLPAPEKSKVQFFQFKPE
jgi:hypothetical protein